MPITVTLPDGSKKVFEKPVSGLEVAKAIGPRLAKAALGVKVDGELRDLASVIDRDATVSIVTDKKRDGSVDPDALFLMRHSAAHVMAEAIQNVIGKDVLLAYGPPTETGFFYDMAVPAGKAISSGDFERIDGVFHAGVWRGTAASWIDLHAFLPPEFTTSTARGIWHDGRVTRVVGGGFNSKTMRVEALMWVGLCNANCDQSTTPPVLNVNDFQCFLTRYAGGDPYANCDSSTSPPVLNVNDFQCFLQQYAAGCP